MRLPFPAVPRLSLRARLSAGVLAIVFLTTMGVTAAALHFLKRNMEAAIAGEEFERISAIAGAVDQKFLSRRTLLKAFGDGIESRSLAGPGELQDLVMQHGSLREAFDNVAFTGMDGELVANLNGTQPIGKVNIKDREYFQRTVAARAGVISKPFRNRVSGLAQIALTEPVLDRGGNVVYVITAFVNLKEKNFLGELANVKFGKSGYMFITDTDGIVIDHPDRSRLLQRADAGGARNPATERAIAGFEGTMEAVDPAGVHGLYAFKRIGQTNWVLGAMYPRNEAFARIDRIERYAWAGALLLTLLAGGLAFMTARAQLAPLSRLREHMQVSRAATAYAPMQEAPPDDEVGDLSRTFDLLMSERQAANEKLAASERFLRDVTDNLPAVVAYFDSSQRCLFANKAGLGMRGRTMADIGRMTMQESLPDHVYQQLVPGIAKVLAGTPTRTEGTYERNGKLGFFECHLAPDIRDDGVLAGYYVMTFDVSKRKQAEMHSAGSERRLRGLTDNVPALLAELDLEERVVFCNGKYQAWLGVSPEAMTNRPIHEAIGEAHYEIRKPLLARAFAGEVVSFEQTASLLIGERTLQTTYLPQRNAQGAVTGLYILSNDVTELKQKQMKLDALAREDALTGLPNRRSFEEHARDAMARSRRAGLPVCLLFLDIDYFKSINDSLGHAAGDAVLREFGRRLRESVRETDMAARYAGDEFVILLEGASGAAEAQVVAGKVLAAMRPPFHLPGRTLQATTSIGVAISEEDEDFPSLFVRADTALYAAKKEGKNRFMMAAPRPGNPGGAPWPREEPSSA
ncbi:PAS domain S-box-containing protein/diguanylate cyclase (GGDEF)-like protein [Variovorax beijingensis]|uniref:PAS domain S-box-containing protein/diguanylate cyclase (GGDEF)-like protein n=1 Tax=Variovorax beijingensis TaxID=2496117 RepID=A0A561C804_9BURK|nr:diguanylate cyclase [Variovorax beijingensis]TWD87188.1 PAS domain S-box-containing protein/diguanylate cyclase (GGDEF)-like protein [Variovorax beijingensis]